MDMPNIITSNSTLPNIEQHFRVSAGPGAGKTHWLIQHIKNVLHYSNRLGKTRNIACITYTNIAVETILGRLGTSIDRVEVSTIHSFLYRHIVKPYIGVSGIATEYGLDTTKMDGHDDFVMNTSKLKNWLENHPRSSALRHPYTINQLVSLASNKDALKKWLATLSYQLQPTGIIQISSKRQGIQLKKPCLDALEQDFMSFKKQYWQDGTLHHDDVLFFSYEIIKKCPFVLTVLRKKFPYFFVDEFQDSNPIQVEILRQIGQEETIVGIIGDKAQSIFKFQGADPTHFHTFFLPTPIEDYQLSENRRSTEIIISLLNRVRTDIIQTQVRNAQGEKVRIIVGDKMIAMQQVRSTLGNTNLQVLSYKNDTVSTLQGQTDNTNYLNQLKEKDNNARRNVIVACIRAIELARKQKFKEAIKELVSISEETDAQAKKKQALTHLQKLLENYATFQSGTLYVFYSFVKASIYPTITNLVSGGAKTFYEGHSYQQLALCIDTKEEANDIRTIHKSKGDEFENVLVVLEKEDELNFILTPQLTTNEEHRVRYVAVSRAKDRLFINVPTLDTTRETNIREMGLFEIEYL